MGLHVNRLTMKILRFFATAALVLACTLPDPARAAQGAPESTTGNISANVQAAGAAAKRDALRVGTAVKNAAKKTAGKARKVALEATDATKRQARKVAAFTKSTALKAKSAIKGDNGA